ncbi:hypothetical protein VIMS_04103 [Mycobacterium marinum]|nr:hypothetical protein VIMS_04103 [Mycobacterium marinum]
MWWGDPIDAAMGSGDWVLMAVLMIALWGAVIAGLVALFRVGSARDHHPDRADTDRSRATLVRDARFGRRESAVANTAGAPPQRTVGS